MNGPVMQRFWLAIAGLSGALAVAADAAARHLLAGDAYRLEVAATAARYGLLHAVALAAHLERAGADRGGGAARLFLTLAGWCFVAGVLFFCGSLYALAVGAPPQVARATPVGGTLFIAGWAALLLAALSPRRARS
jgi:uncharacterized membrane protein YgdD (TMEM256/DUF423 family)